MASNGTYMGLSVECLLYEFVISALIIGLLCIFGLIGNILAFITFGTTGQHNASTALFRALAVADSLMLLFASLLYVPEAFADYMELRTPCFASINVHLMRYIYPVSLTAQSITVWISVLLAINRYIAVCKPLMALSLCTVSNARKQLCAVVIFCIVVMSSRFFEMYIIYTKTEGSDETSTDLMVRSWVLQGWYEILRWTIYIVVVFITPFGVILILGVKVVFAIHSNRTKLIRRHSKRAKSDNPVTRLVLIILLVFLICQIPALVNQLLWIILPDDVRNCGGFQFYFRGIANVFAIMNSAVNFPIYMVLNKTFRNKVCSMFRKTSTVDEQTKNKETEL